MFGIFGTQECALVMIEPPGKVGMRGVFKIDNDIRIAVEQRVFEELISPMGQAGVFEPSAGIKPLCKNRVMNAADAAPSKQWS